LLQNASVSATEHGNKHAAVTNCLSPERRDEATLIKTDVHTRRISKITLAGCIVSSYKQNVLLEKINKKN